MALSLNNLEECLFVPAAALIQIHLTFKQVWTLQADVWGHFCENLLIIAQFLSVAPPITVFISACTVIAKRQQFEVWRLLISSPPSTFLYMLVNVLLVLDFWTQRFCFVDFCWIFILMFFLLLSLFILILMSCFEFILFSLLLFLSYLYGIPLVFTTYSKPKKWKWDISRDVIRDRHSTPEIKI